VVRQNIIGFGFVWLEILCDQSENRRILRLVVRIPVIDSYPGIQRRDYQGAEL
jgi:hypothetical protein